MVKLIRVFTVVVVLSIGLAGAVGVAADEGVEPVAPAFDVRSVEGTGEYISILGNDGKQIRFTQGEAFYLRHGFGCGVDDGSIGFDRCMRANTNVQFYVIKRGRVLRPLHAEYVEEQIETEEGTAYLRSWLVDFPEGWPTVGRQTFGATYILSGKIWVTAAVTVNFVAP